MQRSRARCPLLEIMDRANALMGCAENSPEEAELAALTDVIDAYERQRWPEGRTPGGKD